jgi:hypothetical protein
MSKSSSRIFSIVLNLENYDVTGINDVTGSRKTKASLKLPFLDVNVDVEAGTTTVVNLSAVHQVSKRFSSLLSFRANR